MSALSVPEPELKAAEAEASHHPAAPDASAAAASAKHGLELPWVEKYRPRVLADVAGNSAVVDRLKAIEADGNVPHMMLSGLPGIGKTTSVLCLARSLLGAQYKNAVLELNASDERGIDVVRSKIKQFASKAVTLPPGQHKIVILDEADSMTAGAQQALRRTMELYSGSTRFCFACNQSNKIIDPIQSRCAILRFTKLSDENILERLLQICEAEDVSVLSSSASSPFFVFSWKIANSCHSVGAMDQVKYTHEGLGALLFTADGDMRQAVNSLQSTWAGFGFVTPENVFKVVDQPHPKVATEILHACIQGQLDLAVEILDEVWTEGYSALDIITTLFRVTKTLPNVPDQVKLDFVREIGLTHMRILEGVATRVQLGGLLARLTKYSLPPDAFRI